MARVAIKVGYRSPLIVVEQINVRVSEDLIKDVTLFLLSLDYESLDLVLILLTFSSNLLGNLVNLVPCQCIIGNLDVNSG